MNKVLFLGDSGVGKTTLCHKLANKRGKIEVTIGVNIVQSNEEDNTFVFHDYSGQERFKSIALTQIKGMDLIVVCFDLTCQKSFEKLKSWLDGVRSASSKTPIILVANKSDLVDKIVVEKDSIDKLVQKYNIVQLETSAKNGAGIEELKEAINSRTITTSNTQTEQPTSSLMLGVMGSVGISGVGLIIAGIAIAVAVSVAVICPVALITTGAALAVASLGFFAYKAVTLSKKEKEFDLHMDPFHLD